MSQVREPRGTAMSREMGGQPEVVAALTDRRGEIAGLVGGVTPAAGILLIARGSSDNAAVHGRYLLELALGRPVALAAPSLFTRYHAATRLEGWLAIGVSQSGATPEVVDALAAAQHLGADGLALTNVAGSPISEAADRTLWLDAGDETAVPATKTFTAQVAAFTLLAEALGGPLVHEADWDRTIEAMRTVLDDPAPAERVGQGLAGAGKLLAVGRGLTYAVALETGLKLAETTGLPSHGTSTADLLHGPIAATGPEVAVVAFPALGPCLGDVTDAVARLATRGCPVVTVGEPGTSSGVGVPLGLPPGIPEVLHPLVGVIRGQQLAHTIALALDRDPDQPDGLSKVTPTR